MNTPSIATVGQQPTQNPDYVHIVCPMFSQLHGLPLNYPVATLRKGIFCRDKHGFEIYVHSIRYNRSVWVSSKEYSLIPEKKMTV